MNIQVICPKCGVYNELADSKCWKCSRRIEAEEKEAARDKGDLEKAAIELLEKEKKGEIIRSAKESGDWSKVPDDVCAQEAQCIALTTSFMLAGQDIEKEIEIVAAEVVFGVNIFRDLFAGVRDIVGGRSAATQKVLKEARQTVLTEIRKEALMIGADAVIAMDLDYQELSGVGSGGMLMLVASGTAVKTK